MLFAIALLALVDEFEAAAENVKFPSDEIQAQWARKGETHRKVVKLVTDRRGWARAFETIQKKLGLGPGKIDIDVLFHESDDNRLATSSGRFGYGTVKFNMKLLVPHQKKLDEIDVETRNGKLAPMILPSQRLEGLITHELTHILSGGGDTAWVAEGLATFAAGEDYFLFAFNSRGGRVETIDRTLPEHDVYPRGLCFFRWVEKEHGSDKLKDLAVRVASGTEKTSAVAAEVLGRTWEQILAREKAWTTEYLATFKTAR